MKTYTKRDTTNNHIACNYYSTILFSFDGRVNETEIYSYIVICHVEVFVKQECT